MTGTYWVNVLAEIGVVTLMIMSMLYLVCCLYYMCVPQFRRVINHELGLVCHCPQAQDSQRPIREF